MQQWTVEAFIGGHPALDFLNTVDNHDKTRSDSRIGDWPGFLAWAAEAQLFTAEERRRLTSVKPAHHPGLLGELHSFRETCYAVVSALAAERYPPARPWRGLQEAIGVALMDAELVPGEAHFVWRAGGDTPLWVVDALALSMERLLRDPALGRLRECGRCSWLFLDHGRGRGRRWCDMRTCGNRAKAEAFRRAR